jgi:hypothetical protein
MLRFGLRRCARRLSPITRLNSLAMSCFWALVKVMLGTIVTMASGLPKKGVAVKTSRMWKGRVMMVM